MTEEKKPVQKQSKKQEAPKKVAPAPAAKQASTKAVVKPEAAAQKVEKKPEAAAQKTIKDRSDQTLVGKTIECFLGSCFVEEIRSAGGNSSDSRHDIIKVRKIADNTTYTLRRRQL